jgi:hypothetical protein
MLMSWARPLLASIALALRSSDSGIPKITNDIGGFAISYNVKIVFGPPVEVTCKDNKPPARRGGITCSIGVSRRALTYNDAENEKREPIRSPFLGQLAVEQDHSRRLDGLVHCEVLADHDTEDTSE